MSIGLVMHTCLPARSACRAIPACEPLGVHRPTTSTSSRASNSS